MTARDVYERSLALLGELDSDGDVQPDVAAFEKSAPELLSTLLVMTDSVDALMKGETRDPYGHLPQRVKSLDDELYVHPRLAAAALPLGLCFFLISEEDTRRGGTFYKLFEDELAEIRSAYKKGKRKKTVRVV